MFSSIWVKIIGGLLAAAIVGGLTWSVINAYNQAAKVPGLEKEIEDLEKSAAAFQAALDKQTEAAKNRIAENTKIADNQNTKQKVLINENGKSPSVAIPANKLRALLEADAATQY